MNEHATSFASNLRQVLADMASQASSAALSTDPQLHASLLALEGRIIEVQCTAPNLTWQLHIRDGGIHTQTQPNTPAHVVVRGSGSELAKWLAPGQPPSNLQITGDENLLLAFSDIVKKFRPDLEKPLGNIVGSETAAHLIGTLEMGLQGLRKAFDQFGASAAQRATETFVSNSQVDSLLTGVDDLRLRVDRLAAKISARERLNNQTR